MTMRGTDSCPAEILEWIAWYPDGGLSEEQRGAVEAHAVTCPGCREELAVLAGRSEAPVAPADPERLFARVLALVEAEGLATPGRPPALAGLATLAPALRQRAPVRWATPPWSRGFAQLAASTAAVLLAGAVGGWLGRDLFSAREPVAVTASEAAAGGGGLALDVEFRSDATAERIRTALRGLGAELVAGPSPLGRYRVVLPPGTDASAAAALLGAEGTGVASSVEPLRP